MNALKTGLTGRTVLLPTDDADLYEKHLESFRSELNPVGEAETRLVQAIADTAWRLARIPGLEAGIYTLGFSKLASLHAEEKDEQKRKSLIQVEVFLAYEKQLRNLALQESRLRRHMEKDTAALKQLQKERQANQKQGLDKAANLLIEAIKNGQARSFDPKAIGFEFSLAEIEKKAAQLQPQMLRAYEANKPRHLRNAA